jgi:hypothetical protein
MAAIQAKTLSKPALLAAEPQLFVADIEKLPAQSSRAVISAASRSPASSGFGIGIRSNTTPQVRGSADPLARSPKSLSKVSKIRCSRRPCQHLRVGHAWRNDSDPHDIVPSWR